MIAADGASAFSGLFADFYALSMAQGYWKADAARGGRPRGAIFEYFFRRQPFGGGYAVFAGLGTLLDALAGFSFSDADVAFLRGMGVFDEDFLGFLRGFRFSGSLHAMDEGSIVFPREPIVRVTGSLVECQIIEGMLLNALNFQSMVATKARRVVHAARGSA